MSGPAPATTKMVDLAGKPVEVPTEQATQAFGSRQFGFAPGSRVPIVTEDGQVGTVPAEEAHASLGSGARIASSQELRSAEVQSRHGGVAGALGAFGEGIARGATFGLSDAGAVGLAEILGHGRETREAMAERKEANPIAAFGGEAIGTAAPLFVPGAGEAAAGRLGAEGAALARGGGSLAEAGRAFGAIPRGVSALGQGAERLAAGVVGEGSDIMAHRVAQQIVRKAAGAAVEGAAFGAGNEVSESALGDHELNGERLLAAMGHTALVGGILGGALGGAGRLAAEGTNAALRKLAPKLSEEAGEQAWKALSPLKKYSEQANARAGGTAAVGRTLLEEGVIPKEEGLIAAAMTPEELAPRLTEAKERVGQQIGALLENSKGVVSMRELLDPIDEVIKRESAKAGHEHIVASLERYRASLAEKLGLTRSAGYSPGVSGVLEHRVPGGLAMNDVAEELQGKMLAGAESKGATAHLPGGLPSNDNAVLPFRSVEVPGGAAGNDNALVHLPGGVGANDNAAKDLVLKQTVRAPGGLAANENARAVPVQELVAQRRALDELVYKEAKSLDPNQRVALLREVRGVMHGAEVEAIDRAAQTMGGPGGAELKALNRKYQHLSLAEEAAEASTSRMATNRNLSASDYAAAVASAASGHPLAAPVLAIGHRVVRERGNAVAAVALDRLSQLGMIQRASAQVDREVGQAVRGYLSAREPAVGQRLLEAERRAPVRVRTFDRSEEPAGPSERYTARVDEVRRMAGRPALRAEQVSAHLGGMGSHAPQTVSAVTAAARRGTAFLASKIPPGHTNQTSLTPHLDKPRIAATEMSRFLRYADAVDDPLQLVDDLHKGRVTKEGVEAVKTVYPKLYGSMRQHVTEALTERKTALSYEQRCRLGQLLDIPADKTMEAPFQKSLQSAYGPPPPEAQAKVPSGKKIAVAESFKSGSQKIEEGGK